MTRFPRVTAEFEVREVGDEVIVHDPLHDKVHVLNRTAAFVLRLCDGTRTPDQIAASLGTAFVSTSAAVATDVDAILHAFADAELIERETP